MAQGGPLRLDQYSRHGDMRRHRSCQTSTGYSKCKGWRCGETHKLGSTRRAAVAWRTIDYAAVEDTARLLAKGHTQAVQRAKLSMRATTSN